MKKKKKEEIKKSCQHIVVLTIVQADSKVLSHQVVLFDVNFQMVQAFLYVFK